MPTHKMFGDIFVKIFKFPRILYSFYKILAIFRVKYFYPIKFGRIILGKNGNWGIFFGKKHGKLAHGKNLAPKIFPIFFLKDSLLLNSCNNTSLGLYSLILMVSS
jgi:hypothetical protein